MTTANGLTDTADLEALLSRLMIKLFPGLASLNVRTYKVRKVYSDTANYGRCDLALESDPEQQLPRVDQWPGIAGGVSLPVVGTLCEVTWRDGAEKSPVIVGFQPLRVTGGKPDETKIDAAVLRLGPTADAVLIAGEAPAAKKAARKGDAVSLGYLVGVAGAGPSSLPVTFQLLATAPISGPSQLLTGVISQGSDKVVIG